MFQEIAGVFDGRVLMSCELVLCLFFVGIYCSYELNVVFGDCIWNSILNLLWDNPPVKMCAVCFKFTFSSTSAPSFSLQV